jgi:hypothetical protein
VAIVGCVTGALGACTRGAGGGGGGGDGFAASSVGSGDSSRSDSSSTGGLVAIGGGPADAVLDLAAIAWANGESAALKNPNLDGSLLTPNPMGLRSREVEEDDGSSDMSSFACGRRRQSQISGRVRHNERECGCVLSVRYLQGT